MSKIYIIKQLAYFKGHLKIILLIELEDRLIY